MNLDVVGRRIPRGPTADAMPTEACPDLSDIDLVRGMAAGDRAALAVFYDRHAPQVLGLLVRWLKHRVDAEDVLQEVFWQAWSSAVRFDPGRATPLGWLFVLAKSRAIDHLRRRRPQSLPNDALEREAGEDPLADVERTEAFQEVQHALSLLPQEQSRAIRLAFYRGLTHAEVAQQESIPVGTAKTRIRLGIQRLRSHFSVSEES